MDEDRIIKTQCSFCGSRLKKIAEIRSKVDNDMIGYSLICCNCGHVDNFALDTSAIPIYTIGMRDNIKVFDLRCAIPIESKIKCDMRCDMERPCTGCKKPMPKPEPPKPSIPEKIVGERPDVPAPRVVQTISNDIPFPPREVPMPSVKKQPEPEVSATITAKPKNTMRPISFNGSETKYQ
jgi:hypothetical protein